MKRLLFLLTVVSGATANAQSIWNPGSGTDVTTTTTGNVFIQGGTIDLNTTAVSGDVPRTIAANSTNSWFNIRAGHSNLDGAEIGLYATGAGGHLNFSTVGPDGSYNFFRHNGTAFQSLVKIDAGALRVQNGIIDLTNITTDAPRTIMANSVHSSFNVLSGHDNSDGAWIGMHAILDPGQEGNMNFHAVGQMGAFSFFKRNGTAFESLVKIDNTSLRVQRGDIDLTNIYSDAPRNITANSVNSWMNFNAGHSNMDGATIGLFATGAGGHLNFSTVGPDGSYNFFRHNGTAFQSLVKIDAGALRVQNGIIDLTNITTDAPRTIMANSVHSSFNILAGHNASDGAWIGLHAISDPGQEGNMNFHSVGTGGFAFFNYNASTSAFDQHMKISNGGKVIIGKDIMGSAPDGYLLYVEKGILTEKLRVANSGDLANWADFVFDDDYQLMSLKNVESYIKKNKHLPEIPTTDEVKANGIDIVEMNIKLLQKVEELTLYVIQQQGEIEKLKAARK